MIATALIFLLGALTATLIVLLFVPLVWRRAQRLARREFNATIPTSVNEIRAEMDLVRATSAFSLRREERRARELTEQAARERGEAGRVILENGHLLARKSELEETLTERDKRIAFLDDRLRAVSGERDELIQARQELRTRLQARSEELEAFALRHQALKERSEEQRQRIGHAEARIAKLEEALRLARAPGSAPAAPQSETPAADLAPSEPIKADAAKPAAVPIAAKAAPVLSPLQSGSERLRRVLRTQASASEPTPPAPAATPSPAPAPTPAPAEGNENAEIRERISDIAARVIQKEIENEGPHSPLRAMIDRPEPARETGSPSLAERVRSLLAAPAPEPAREEAASAAPSDLISSTTPDAPPARPPAAKPAPSVAKKSGGGRSRPKSRR